MADLAFQTMREYKRVYSIFHITEDGIYKEDNVPEDYSGSGELKVEVVHEVVLADNTGRLLHKYYEIPDAMDNEQKLGGGYSLDGEDVVDHDWYPNQAGPSDVRTKLYTRESTFMSSTNKQKAAFVLQLSVNQKAEEEASE